MEGCPVIGDADQVIQTEHLKAAAVGQDRAVPAHESMQPSEPGNAVGARAEREVIAVAEENLRAECSDFIRAERLDRRLRADRHERRGIDRAVGGRQAPSASPVLLGDQLKHAQ